MKRRFVFSIVVAALAGVILPAQGFAQDVKLPPGFVLDEDQDQADSEPAPVEAENPFQKYIKLGPGIRAYSAGNYDEALRELRPLAEQGLVDAQFYLGTMYLRGQGVPENKTEAARWYRLAAERGLGIAQVSLGLMYDNGEGMPENDAEAVRLYRLAAEQGYASAQTNLGFMYAKGEGVPENNVTAYMWMNLAAAQGNKMASGNKDILVKRMTAADISRAQQLSQACMARNYKGC
jgi:TPR repeat protein